MLQIKLTSGHSLSFDSLASVLDWSPHWELIEDEQGECVYNSNTRSIIGRVVYN